MREIVNLREFIRAMPKAELHVHFQGATRPETLLKLAKRNGVELPVSDVDGLREWYVFRDFPHFADIYDAICRCIQTAEDIELLAREFVEGQAAQNIVYSEVTYTPPRWILFDQQLAALNRAWAWGTAKYGVRVNVVIDIPRQVSAENGLWYAEAAISGIGKGIVAFGIGGPEVGHPPEKHAAAFARARAAGLPCVPHAGETMGPESIWSALRVTDAVRIGHGVCCLEDPALVDELRVRQIPLEVCPTSNVCLGVVPNLAAHPLPRLMAEGLYVTVNSDDPPMFNTTLTDEYLAVSDTFGFSAETVEQLVMNGVRAALLPDEEKAALEARFAAEFQALRGIEEPEVP